MKMKGVKDGIEGLGDVVQIIGEIIPVMHGRAGSNILLDECMEAPDKLERTFCVLLALNDILGCVVDELWSKIALEDGDYKIKSLFGFVTSVGMLRDFVEIACRVFLKQALRNLERCSEALHCFLSTLSVSYKPCIVSVSESPEHSSHTC